MSITHDPLADPRLFEDFDRQLQALTPDAGIGPRIYRVGPDGRFHQERQFAVNSLPTYPGGGPQVTVDSAIQNPNIIARALTDLAYQRFVADRVLMRGTSDQVRGGAAVFQRAESLFPDRGAEEVGVRSEWPRSGWTVPDLFAAAVKKYGLEVPISDESVRRNAMDVMARAQRKLANAVVKFVDQVAMTLIETDPAVQTLTAGATWSTGTSIIADLASARNKIQNIDLGYVADTLIINPAQELSMLTNTTLQSILPRESTPRNATLTGSPVPILGLQQILVTNQITAGTGIVLNSGVVGTIAEEAPDPREGYVGYNPGANQPNIMVKRYREEDRDEWILRAARFPAMWISEPQAAVVISGM